MAGVLVDNVHFLRGNTSNQQIVPNPTYGRYGVGSSGEDVSEIAETMDYQSVSAYNPNYSTVDLSKKTKFRSVSPADDGEKNGIPIPGRPQNGATTGHSHHSVPKTNGRMPCDSPPAITQPTSFSSSIPSCGSPTPLLPPRGMLHSQTSQTSGLSSSNSECGGVGEKPSPPAQATVVTQSGSEYSYAQHPSAVRGKSFSEQRSEVTFSTQSSHIDKETATSLSTEKPSSKNMPDTVRTVRNISYGEFRSNQQKDNLKLYDFSSTIEIVIVVFAIVSILISLLVIILFVVFLVKLDRSSEATSSGVTTTVDQAVLDNNGTVIPSCNCPGMFTCERLHLKKKKSTL